MAFQSKVDFGFKGQVPIASIVEAFRNKSLQSAQLQQRQQQLDQQQKQQELQQTLSLVRMGGQIAQTMVETSRRRQLKTDRDAFVSLLASQDEIFPLGLKPIAPGPTGQAGPGFGPRAEPVLGRRGDQPGFKTKLKTAGLKAFPNVFAPQAAKELFGGTISSGDLKIRPLEMANGKTQDVIVNKQSGKVFGISGEFAGREIPKEVLVEAQKGFAPALTKDLEGRPSIVTKGGKVKGVFREEKAPKTGKERAKQLNPREQQAVIRVRKAISSDKVLNADREALGKSHITRNLLKQNRPGSTGFVRTQLAKAAGEQRITEQDIERFSGSPAFKAKALRAYTSIIDGNLPPSSVGDYLALLDVFEKTMSERLNTQITSQLQSLEFDLEGANMDKIRDTIAPGILPFLKKSLPKQTPTEEMESFFGGL